MKLELKHLAPYLPYGLKRHCPTSSVLIHDYMPLDFIQSTIDLHVIFWWKPILRPMSDLTRPMLEDAGFRCHIDWLTNEFNHWVKMYGFEQAIDRVPYGHIKYLIENHFDVFNLIPAGLALDINTIEPLNQ